MITAGPLVAVGRTSDVYEFGQGSVVKVPRPEVPSHWAAMEARFTAAVREHGAPAPAVRDVIEVEGRDSIVFERVNGPSMWELMTTAPKRTGELARQLAAVQRRILRAGLPRGLEGLVDRMCGKIAEVELLSHSERVEAQEMVRALPRGAALLHGDLHPGNVLMADQGPVVIDWFDVTIGHPVADVVRSSVLVRPYGFAYKRPHLADAPAGLFEELHEAYVMAMIDVLVESKDQVRDWEAVVAAGRLSEDIESAESALLSLWNRRRDRRAESSLLELISAGPDQSTQ